MIISWTETLQAKIENNRKKKKNVGGQHSHRLREFFFRAFWDLTWLIIDSSPVRLTRHQILPKTSPLTPFPQKINQPSKYQLSEISHNKSRKTNRRGL